MKLKDGYILSEIAGKTVAVPTDGDLDLNTMLALNETGAFLWNRLQNETSEDELVDALLEVYDVDEATARRSVNAFVRKLKENGIIG